MKDLENFVDSLQEEELLQLKEIVLRKSYWVWESIKEEKMSYHEFLKNRGIWAFDQWSEEYYQEYLNNE